MLASATPTTDWLPGLLHGEPLQQRRAMAKAITLLESTRPDHLEQADAWEVEEDEAVEVVEVQALSRQGIQSADDQKLHSVLLQRS